MRVFLRILSAILFVAAAVLVFYGVMYETAEDLLINMAMRQFIFPQADVLFIASGSLLLCGIFLLIDTSKLLKIFGLLFLIVGAGYLGYSLLSTILKFDNIILNFLTPKK